VKIKLLNLKIENFKGIKNLVIDFGDSNNIYGQNASGKTTVADAFNWLLFNKDSQGVEKFNIRPLDERGDIINNVEISVAALLLVDGQEVTLSKVQKQNWVKKRGSEEATLEGNNNFFEIDGFPKTEKDFKKYIDSLILEDLFKLITSPQAFISLPWKKQREALTELITDISNEEIIAADKKFSILAVDLSKYSADDLMSRVAKVLKEWKKQQTELPARIDEVSKSITVVDLAEEEEKRKKIQKAIAAIEVKELDFSKSLDGIMEINNAILKKTGEKAKLEREVKQEYQDRLNQVKATSDTANDLFNKAVLRHTQTEKQLEHTRQNVTGLKKENEKLLEKYNELKNSRFDEHSLSCPMCKQSYTDTKKAQIFEEFEVNVRTELNRMDGIGKARKEEIKSLEVTIQELMVIIEEAKTQKIKANGLIANANKELEELEQVEILYPAERATLDVEIMELQEKLEQMNTGTGYRNQLAREKQVLIDELLEVDKKLSLLESNKKASARITELEEELREVAQKIAEQEKLVYLLEEFIVAKMNLISSRINAKFNLVDWKLFNTQMNGGIKETCECMLNGVPFASLNTAGKLQAGLDIINTLSVLYGAYAPIWIDNRESCTEIPEADSQVINLYVSAKDTELRTEVVA
jgi:hypothetical protein